LRERFDEAGWTELNPSHLENVFRTNIMSAYGSGRREQMTQPAVLSARPYWQILTVKDDRTRKTHRALDRKLLRADDPFWAHAAPPFGYNCRCRIVSRTQADVDRGVGELITGADVVDIPDEGFDAHGITAPPPVQIPREAPPPPAPRPVPAPEPPKTPAPRSSKPQSSEPRDQPISAKTMRESGIAVESGTARETDQAIRRVFKDAIPSSPICSRRTPARRSTGRPSSAFTVLRTRSGHRFGSTRR
jgi:SPP1 gp7 family putative phage head morphogenesis protein